MQENVWLWWAKLAWWDLTGINVDYGFHTKRYIEVVVEASLIMNVCVWVWCVYIYAGKGLSGFIYK